jgi:release factor glutamine methyltransferase
MRDGNQVLYRQLCAELEARLQLLPDKPEETAENCLKALWAFAAGNPVSATVASQLQAVDLSEEQQGMLNAVVEQRLSGVPLAHITGRQGFMGIELLASKSALIPRKETEILASLALKSIDEISTRVDVPLVIDVCTGSGNLALAVLTLRPEIKIWGADLSEEAVSLASDNAGHLGLDGKIRFLPGDLLAPFDSGYFHNKVDLIICNPPYILSSNVPVMAPEISQHEPEMAFNGGPFGIQILDRIIKESARYLKPGAWLCLELGAGQGPFVEKRIVKSGLYEDVDLACDSAGVVRALRARLLSRN